LGWNERVISRVSIWRAGKSRRRNLGLLRDRADRGCVFGRKSLVFTRFSWCFPGKGDPKQAKINRESYLFCFTYRTKSEHVANGPPGGVGVPLCGAGSIARRPGSRPFPYCARWKGNKLQTAAPCDGARTEIAEGNRLESRRFRPTGGLGLEARQQCRARRQESVAPTTGDFRPLF